MGLTIVNKNEIFVVERFVVNKKDNKFYLTINSKYVIPGILSNVFFDEKDVIARLVACLSEHKVFDVEKEFHSFDEPLTAKEYTTINSTSERMDIISNTGNIPTNEDEDLNIDFTGEFSIDESTMDTAPKINISSVEGLGDLFNGEPEFSSDSVDREPEFSSDLVNREPEFSSDLNKENKPPEVEDVRGSVKPEVELTSEDIDNMFWGDVADTVSVSITDVVTSNIDKQQRLHVEGKLSKEEIDKVNNTNKKYVSVMNTDRAKNKIDYFNNISNSDSEEKDKSTTVDKLKLSFRGILKLLSLTE